MLKKKLEDDSNKDKEKLIIARVILIFLMVFEMC